MEERAQCCDDDDDKVIGYRGRWYNVTSFIKRHPGGDVIEKFLGHDATYVIDSIHKYDVLKNRKSVGSYEMTSRGFDQSMNELEMKFRREGYYDNSFWWCAGKSVITLSLLVLEFVLVINNITNTSGIGLMFSGFILALFWQQSGILMHDFMHSQLFRRRSLDEKCGIFFGTVCFGISARWWKDEHVIHHALTNTIDYETNFIDPQANEEVWAQNEKLFPFHSSAFKAFCIKIQHLLFLPLTVGVGRFAIMIDSFSHERRLDVWVAWMIHWAWLVQFLSYFPTFEDALTVYWIGCLGEGVLHIQLLLNHYSKRFYSMEEKHSQEYYRTMIDSNLNITSPWWMDWFHGGLNFHHEHHSFPRLPRNRLREASSHVKKICERHNVHYDECTFSAALWRTLRNFVEVSETFKTNHKNDD